MLPCMVSIGTEIFWYFARHVPHARATHALFQDQILRSYETTLRVSIPLAVAAAHEGTIELEDCIVSLTDRLAQVESSSSPK